MAGVQHIPVLLPEVTDLLAVKPGGLYLDATFGLGGYSRYWLERGARVIATDRDPAAVPLAEALKAQYPDAFTFHALAFSRLGEVCAPGSLDGVAFDLGVSSPQLDVPERGFSFRFDAPLDMRMEQQGVTAADMVNSLDVRELAKIIKVYGEEKFAMPVARAIGRAREVAPIGTTGQLAALVRRTVPKSRDGIDQATRTFQALRIAVNRELEEVEVALPAAVSACRAGGVVAVVSFHSLEDRIVKHFFREQAGSDAGSRHLPPGQGAGTPLLKIVTTKAISASAHECNINPRARSARLRAAVKQ